LFGDGERSGELSYLIAVPLGPGEVLMADDPPQTVRLFWWVMPAVYLLAWVVLMIGNVVGAGHTPQALGFLVFVVSAPCYVLDLVLPRGLLPLIISLLAYGAFGICFWLVIGLSLDILLKRLRRGRRN
jgi:hypothetical protein